MLGGDWLSPRLLSVRYPLGLSSANRTGRGCAQPQATAGLHWSPRLHVGRTTGGLL